MYRASTNPPKTAWARHLDQVMRDRGWSRVRLFEEVAAELDYSAKSRSALLPLLAKKEPSEAQAAVLRKHFGDPPEEPEAEVQAVEPEPTLASALSELVAELRESRKERAAMAQKMEEMEAILDGLVERAKQAGDGRSAPLGSKG